MKFYKMKFKWELNKLKKTTRIYFNKKKTKKNPDLSKAWEAICPTDNVGRKSKSNPHS